MTGLGSKSTRRDLDQMFNAKSAFAPVERHCGGRGEGGPILASRLIGHKNRALSLARQKRERVVAN